MNKLKYILSCMVVGLLASYSIYLIIKTLFYIIDKGLGQTQYFIAFIFFTLTLLINSTIIGSLLINLKGKMEEKKND